MTEPRHPDLEARIQANLDDHQAWAVYGDWLGNEGDPRGELIALSLEEEGEASHQARIAEVTREHREAWLGETLADMVSQGGIRLEWARGFIVGATVGDKHGSVSAGLGDEDAAERLSALTASGAARFLQRLHVFTLNQEYVESVAALAEASDGLTCLRDLQLGNVGSNLDEWADMGDVSDVVAAAPHLERLALLAGGMELHELEVPRLNELTVDGPGMEQVALETIADADLPKLETLTLFLGDTNMDSGETMDALSGLFNSSGFPGLRFLVLRGTETTNELVEAICWTPVFEGLEHLDLNDGRLTDQGGRVMIEAADAFAHLEGITLDGNRLDEEVAEELQETLDCQVYIGDQYPELAEQDSEDDYDDIEE